MDTYTIKQAYPYCLIGFEIEIKSENILYAELGKKHSGCQVKNMNNQDLIHDKCIQVAKLIKEIDELNKPAVEHTK